MVLVLKVFQRASPRSLALLLRAVRAWRLLTARCWLIGPMADGSKEYFKMVT